MTKDNTARTGCVKKGFCTGFFSSASPLKTRMKVIDQSKNFAKKREQ